jgi:hypothetical protein
MGETMNAYKDSLEKPKGQIPLGRTRHRWDSNIEMDLKELGSNDVNWIDVTHASDHWRAFDNTQKFSVFLDYVSRY